MPHSGHFLIAGGGIGGLAAAFVLAREGWHRPSIASLSIHRASA
ncbi:MAG: hypothetical protein Q7U62_09050 [Burkholderiaceae bacterium]|nr:hypothetical protein [Burkholderiaceae bacterium]